MSNFVWNWVKLAPNGTNLGPFKISWLSNQKCTERVLQKSQVCPIWGQSDPLWCQIWHPRVAPTSRSRRQRPSIAVMEASCLRAHLTWRHASWRHASWPRWSDRLICIAVILFSYNMLFFFLKEEKLLTAILLQKRIGGKFSLCVHGRCEYALLLSHPKINSFCQIIQRETEDL